MRQRWKALLSDSFVQLAVILSLLRTDLGIYLRQYSGHPEVQQVLLGQSVGLHLSDNYRHHNNHIYPSSKYIDDTDYILNEINRLTRSPIYQHRSAIYSHRTVSTWLLTNDHTSHASTSSASSTATASASTGAVELSQQDVELIERLWKADLETTVGHGAMGFNSKTEVAREYITDEDSGLNIPVPDSFPIELNGGDQRFLPLTVDVPDRRPAPQYNTQSSLERDLQEISPYIGESTQSQDETLTNSSMFHPDTSETLSTGLWSGDVDTNNTGLLWGISNSTEFEPTLNSGMTDTDYTADLLDPYLLDSADLLPTDMDMDFDLDSVDTLAELCNPDGSVSGDSAVSMGSSPQQSWVDRLSDMCSERHSISSGEPFELEEGAIGGYSECKAEPYYDNGFFDYEAFSQISKAERNLVSHDHTYGAPPGGVPHVRKMDIKTPKEPSRGLAHDEAMCRKLRVPFSVDTIINTPLDQFNSLIQKHQLSSKQKTLVKDIRRRGKNKVAAQNCREKRVGAYSEMESEVNTLRSKRNALQQKKAVLLDKTTQVRKHIDIMSAEIFRTLRDENGVPYDSSRVSLEIGLNGEIEVVSNDQSSSRSRNSKKRSGSKRRRR